MNEHFAEIGKRLSHYLIHKGLSQSKLARLTSTSGSQVFNMLNGTRYGVDKLLSIFRALPELSPEWLLFGTGEMEKKAGYFEPGSDPLNAIPARGNNPAAGNKEQLDHDPELEELQAMLQLCQTEKDGLEKILELKDEMIEMLKSQKSKGASN